MDPRPTAPKRSDPGADKRTSLRTQPQDQPPGSLLLRPAQQQAMAYRGGWMGISAVPGSGKTFILESLIADMIGSRGIPADRIGVFTYMRSARANLLRRVNARLEQMDSLERFTDAFTIHSIALKILRLFEGRGEDIQLLEEYEQARLLRQLTRAWLRIHREVWQSLLPDQPEVKRRQQQQETFRSRFEDMCKAVIRTAKHHRRSADELLAQVANHNRTLGGSSSLDSCLLWALQVYESYQIELRRRHVIDYDDLGWRALELMEQHPSIRQEVESWYDYVLEDEAQDSSPLQEDLLKAISHRTGHLVRVGDPNQSITGTFTSANPRYFRAFCQTCQDPSQALALFVTMDQSSRSAAPILALANHVVAWVGTDPQIPPPLRSTFVQQFIQPALVSGLVSGQAMVANPPAAEAAIVIERVEGDPSQELAHVAQQALRSIAQRPDRTVAILVPRNDQGFQLLELFSTETCRVYDLLRSNPQQQQVIQHLKLITAYLGQPAEAKRLVNLTESLRDPLGFPESTWSQVQGWLLGIPLEEWLFPLLGSEPCLPTWADPVTGQALDQWRQRLVTWLTGLRSPWTDVLSLVIQDLYRQPEELQLGHFLIDQLATNLGSQPTADWHRISAELGQMEQSGLSGMPSDFRPHNPEPGSITVATLHKAKGLEWDEVFIVGLSAYEYPLRPEDHPMGVYFLERMDLTAEALSQLRGYLDLTPDRDPEVWQDLADNATARAFMDYAAERLRLLYVGITRAKRRLTLTVSTINRFGNPEQPSRILSELAHKQWPVSKP